MVGGYRGLVWSMEKQYCLGTDEGWRGQSSPDRACMFLGAVDGIKIDTDDNIVILRRINLRAA